MALTYDGSLGITFNDGSQMGTANQLGIRNRIINGNMAIDQRYNGASSTTAGNTYAVDRWSYVYTNNNKFTAQQMNSANTSLSNYEANSTPAGFQNSLKLTANGAYSITSSDAYGICQWIEGYNTADWNWGTSSAATVTLSFWVKSSLTGTFGGAIRSYSGSTYTYPFTYNINSANTWQQVIIVIPGPTSTWSSGTTNGGGVGVEFSIGAGSSWIGTPGAWTTSNTYAPTNQTSLVGTNAATWYITGVQFEKGSVATPFDFRMYGKEMLLCRRYFQQYGLNNDGSGLAPWATGFSTNGASLLGMFTFDQQMRTSPTITYSSPSDFTWIDYSASTNTQYNLSAIASGRISAGSSRIEATATGGTPTTGRGGVFAFGASARVYCSAEL